MKHNHKVEEKHSSLGVKVSHIKKMKDAFKKKEFTNELAWWILLGCCAILTGVIISLIF